MIDISMSWLLLATLSSLTILWVWIKTRFPYSKLNIPPFPVQPWLLVGHFPAMFGNLRDKLKEWRQTGGDIYSLVLGGELHIVVNDFDAIKDILTKQADKIVNLPKTFAEEVLQEHNTGIISGRDDNWKEQRTISLSILRSFGMGKNIMADKIGEEVAVIIDKLAALRGEPTDVRFLLNISVSNVICSVTVGKRFEHDDPYFCNLIAQVNCLMKHLNAVVLLTPFKQLYYLPGDIFKAKKWVKATHEVNEMFSKAFVSKLKTDFSEDQEADNFVVAYLQEMKKKNTKGANSKLDERNLIAIIRTLFLAGTETTSTTILWCLLYMLHHPEVQNKVYQEIEAHVGTTRVPNMSDKPRLVYLSAVIMETQRLASIALTGLRREVSKTFEYRGFTFPKGSIIWPVLDSVHHDKNIWGDPETFRPQRFIDDNGALINHEKLIPFSIGRRACLGESLARMELYLFLSAMFQRFIFEPADGSGQLPTLKENFGGTMVPFPFQLRFIKRRC
ncbi:unnamed protein product [Candidula unifasciata]|uniref:Cytochrome P450 n=1 Tax=Candidula unifasciata TaxID=100452 RepID=A0A8S3ZUU1_9EUPU|nr:unnamed protein product [Candidula unifasciata]